MTRLNLAEQELRRKIERLVATGMPFVVACGRVLDRAPRGQVSWEAVNYLSDGTRKLTDDGEIRLTRKGIEALHDLAERL